MIEQNESLNMSMHDEIETALTESALKLIKQRKLCLSLEFTYFLTVIKYLEEDNNSLTERKLKKVSDLTLLLLF